MTLFCMHLFATVVIELLPLNKKRTAVTCFAEQWTYQPESVQAEHALKFGQGSLARKSRRWASRRKRPENTDKSATMQDKDQAIWAAASMWQKQLASDNFALQARSSSLMLEAATVFVRRPESNNC